MIYLVTNQQELFENETYSIIGLDKCLSLLQSMTLIQVDSETDGEVNKIFKVLFNCQIVYIFA